MDQLTSPAAGDGRVSLHTAFSRSEWARLGAPSPLTMSEDELSRLRGINEDISLGEVADVFLPLARLLALEAAALRALRGATDAFLGSPSAEGPYIIGLAGSPDRPKVELIATDGFLHPNRVLEERGLMHRKGFPESYDQRRLVRFLSDVKSGRPEVSAPVYSHFTYDIVPGQSQVVGRPEMLIVEGLNVLQTPRGASVFVSDFFDFTIYVDAAEEDVARWYEKRFLTLVRTAFQDPSSYFHRYAGLSPDEARRVARRIWWDINSPNLTANILPTRERARLILHKGPDHSVQRVSLRRF